MYLYLQPLLCICPNSVLHVHYSPRAVMIHGVPVKTYNALQNHIVLIMVFISNIIINLRYKKEMKSAFLCKNSVLNSQHA